MCCQQSQLFYNLVTHAVSGYETFGHIFMTESLFIILPHYSSIIKNGGKIWINIICRKKKMF